MKKILYTSLMLLTVVFVWSGCKDQDYLNGFGNYEGGTISSFIPIYDLRNLYKGSDVELSKDAMFGSTSLSGVVVSDYTEKNFTDPATNGLLFMQDKKRLNSLRGIAINLGASAANFLSGDSIHVNIEGAVLTSVNGMLQVKNVDVNKITKVMSNKPFAKNGVPSGFILADPGKYEGTLVSIVDATFNPLLAPGSILLGDKPINDASDNIVVRTLATATFANNEPPFAGNYLGVVVTSTDASGKLIPHIRLRKQSDITPTSPVSVVPDFVITGFTPNPLGTDANYEYIQFRATKDINFATTSYSVVTTNNAGASDPAGIPTNGWATGGLRTFKFNLTSGTVTKGQFFYVGGTGKLINSSSSTSMSSLKWIRSFNYSTTAGDGFGTKTSNLLANSGNAFGVAAFKGTTVDVNTVPMDVIFVHTGGVLFDAGPPAQGYRITKTDMYSPYNALEDHPLDPAVAQPFFLQGSNKNAYKYNTGDGIFYQFNGVFDTGLGKWSKGRVVKYVQLEKTSPISDIENDESTQIK